MARPKSEDKRNAVMDAAMRVIIAHGLGGSTATIAKEAGISNGSLFTYFQTKADLFNHLYLELKTDMVEASLAGVPEGTDLRKQTAQVWSNWVAWAIANPDKRRAIALLGVSDEIAPETRGAASKAGAGLAELVQRLQEVGSLSGTSTAFAGAIMNSLAETTMDFMLQHPTHAKKYSKAGFEAFWRAIS
jgi:AcrR family transcriptional regulator